MKSIIDLAHPASDSFSKAIVKSYKNKKENEGNKVEIVKSFS